jgi:hypothetical protein
MWDELLRNGLSKETSQLPSNSWRGNIPPKEHYRKLIKTNCEANMLFETTKKV